jgi:hypothetical protein
MTHDAFISSGSASCSYHRLRGQQAQTRPPSAAQQSVARPKGRLPIGRPMPEAQTDWLRRARFVPDSCQIVPETCQFERSRAGAGGHERSLATCALTRANAPIPVVGLPGFEPGTSTSRTWRANQAALQPVGAGGSRSPRSLQHDDASRPRGRRRLPAPSEPPGSGTYSGRAASPARERSTTLATRRLSISTTRYSHPPQVTCSPSSGM